MDLRSLVDYEADHDRLGTLSFTPAEPTRARTLTPEAVERFNCLGYLSPLPAFDEVETAALGAYIGDLVDQVVSAPDRRDLLHQLLPCGLSAPVRPDPHSAACACGLRLKAW